MNDEIREAIKLLVQYNWGDELRDFEQMVAENDPNPNDDWHIFQQIVKLDNFLNGTDHTPEYYIEVTP